MTQVMNESVKKALAVLFKFASKNIGISCRKRGVY